LLGAAILAGCMWFYVQHVLVPYQQADAAISGRPRGNLSDLYPRWLGSRELLVHHRDPYTADVTWEIQAGYYGRPLDPARLNDPRDKQGFAYPVYVAFLLAPTIALPFATVQIMFRWLLVALVVISVPLWLRVLRWKPSVLTVVTAIVLVLGSFPALQGIKLQQLSLVVCGLIATSLTLLVSGYLAASGVLLALATIKPQLAIPVAGWLLLWTLTRWRERQRFMWGFVATMVLLLAGSEIVLPGWIGKFRLAVAAYRQYTGGAGSLLDVLLSPILGALLAALIMLAVVAACWRGRRAAADSPTFALLSSLVLAATIVIVPMVAPYNQLLLIPATLILARDYTSLWSARIAKMLTLLTIGLLLWPWLAATALTVGSLFLPASSIQGAWAAPLYTSLGFPLSVLALLAIHARGRLQAEAKV